MEEKLLSFGIPESEGLLLYATVLHNEAHITFFGCQSRFGRWFFLVK